MENLQEIKTLKIKTSKPYGAIICSGATEYLAYAVGDAKKTVIVSDETVFRLYGKKVKDVLKAVGKETYSFIFPATEKSKNKNVLDKLLILLTELNLDKNDCLIALGGGVVSDITGLGAALFKCGIKYINVPTTLVGMASACIGGKTGVEFLGKNDLLGVINHPKIAICDTDFIKTLPQSAIKDGLAEIIRTAITCDAKFFKSLETEELSIDQMIYRSLKAKAKLIAKDEYCVKEQRVLSFASVFKTAVEKLVGASPIMGKGLAFAMTSAVFLAENLKLAKGVKERLKGVLEKFSIDCNVGVNNILVYDKLFGDGRNETEKISIVLPLKVGVAKVKIFTVGEIKEALYGR